MVGSKAVFQNYVIRAYNGDGISFQKTNGVHTLKRRKRKTASKGGAVTDLTLTNYQIETPEKFPCEQEQFCRI